MAQQGLHCALQLAGIAGLQGRAEEVKRVPEAERLDGAVRSGANVRGWHAGLLIVHPRNGVSARANYSRRGEEYVKDSAGYDSQSDQCTCYTIRLRSTAMQEGHTQRKNNVGNVSTVGNAVSGNNEVVECHVKVRVCNPIQAFTPRSVVEYGLKKKPDLNRLARTRFASRRPLYKSIQKCANANFEALRGFSTSKFTVILR